MTSNNSMVSSLSMTNTTSSSSNCCRSMNRSKGLSNYALVVVVIMTLLLSSNIVITNSFSYGSMRNRQSQRRSNIMQSTTSTAFSSSSSSRYASTLTTPISYDDTTAVMSSVTTNDVRPASTTTTTTTTTNMNGLRPQLSLNCMAHTTAKDAGIYIGTSTLLDSEGKSGNAGLGAFTTKKIPFGTYVGEYYGELLSRQQVESRYYHKRQLNNDDKQWMDSRYERNQEITGSYLLELSNNKFVCAEDGDKSNWCRFMNHACDDSTSTTTSSSTSSTPTPTTASTSTTTTTTCSNVKPFDQLTINGDILDYPQFYATRDIEPYEELLWDYGEYFFLEK